MEEIRGAGGVFCSDIARTLIFSGYDPSDSDLIALPNDRAVHKETVRLMELIRNDGIPIVLITGMRVSGYAAIRNFLPHDRGITEHGGVIWTPDGIDETWNAYLSAGIESVREYQKFLNALFRGTKVVQSADRRTMVRLQADSGLSLSIEEIVQRLSRNSPEKTELQEQPINVNGNTYLVKIPEKIMVFPHRPDPPELSIDIIPEMSGKLNALNYMLNEIGISWKKVAGFGDDDNDIRFISNSAFRMTYTTASPGVVTAVDSGEAKYAYKTPLTSHRGAIDVLEKFLMYVSPLMK